MVKFRLILIKQLAIKRKYATNKCFLETRSTEKYLVCLKLLLGSSRRDKRLARQSQEQLQTRLRLSSKLKIKKTWRTHCGAFCGIMNYLVQSVWNYTTKRYPRPFALILWTSFTSTVMKMLNNMLIILDTKKSNPNLITPTVSFTSLFLPCWKEEKFDTKNMILCIKLLVLSIIHVKSHEKMNRVPNQSSNKISNT